VPAFTPDAARVLGDPWQQLRLDAAERVAAATLPTTDEEMWRYSRIAELDLDRYTPRDPHTMVTESPYVHGDSIDEVSDVLGDVAPDVFAEANTVHMAPVSVRVPRGVKVAEPIVVTHVVDHALVALYPRLVIDVGEQAEVTVIERFVTSSGVHGVGSLIVPMVQVRARQGAQVRYLSINELDDDVWLLGHQRAVGERDSSTLLASVALGGHYARMRTEARVVGAGASTRQVALYFAGGEQMHDFRTVQDHDAPNTSSDLLFKGAVADKARSVYTGLIKIREHARGTAAYQTNRNLTLSQGAWAESVPNLEIETNDVRCSHASTVGPIDEEQLYYLESRGIRPEVAERLVVLGFFDEVIDQLPAADLAADLRRRVAAKFLGGAS
jgi:Fe-S cluster assembly protein SufD